VHELDDTRRRAASYLLARLPDNFTTTIKRRRGKRWRRRKARVRVPAALDVGKGGSGGSVRNPRGSGGFK
jgi:hypothetical protein